MSHKQPDIIRQFVEDLQIEDCAVQITSYDRYFGKITPQNVFEKLEKYQDQHLFYLPGVNPEVSKRAEDADILKRGHFTIDVDIRSSWKEQRGERCTDEQIWIEASKILEKIDGTLFEQWRYINFSGNGVHLHYFGEPVPIHNIKWYRYGLQELFESFNGVIESLGWECDLKCSNTGRIMRMIGSYNQKNSPANLVENIYHNPEGVFDLSDIQRQGESYVKQKEAENKRMAAEGAQNRELYGETTFDRINQIPIVEVVVQATGWEHVPPKHFKAPDWPTKGAMFVHATENCLVPGGTRWLPNTQDGYSPYQFVKTYLQLDDQDTVAWFCERYSAIKDAHSDFKRQLAIDSAKARSDAREVAQKAENEFLNEEVESTSESKLAKPSVEPEEEFWENRNKKQKTPPPTVKTFDALMQQLQDVRIEILKTDPFLDDWKILMRGGVTRIGGYSNMGKSTVAYYLLHRLLKNGYAGLVFSTEVVSPIVLASLERIHSGKSTYQIAEGKEYDPEGMAERYQNLMIYDSVDTGNQFRAYEYLVKMHRKMGHDVDFIMVDYVQGVRIQDQTAQTLYDKMTKYAFDIQMLAQKLNICVMDVSQVNNESINKTGAQKAADFVGLKGSGDLFSAAEVVIEIHRDKGNESKEKPGGESADMVPRQTNWVPVELRIRKHKFAPTGEQWTRVDYSTGMIKEGDAPEKAKKSDEKPTQKFI